MGSSVARVSGRSDRTPSLIAVTWTSVTVRLSLSDVAISPVSARCLRRSRGTVGDLVHSVARRATSGLNTCGCGSYRPGRLHAPHQKGPADTMKSGLEIAQEAELRPIADIAAAAGIEPGELEQYGRSRAKVDLSILDRLADQPDGKLVITTAITPTKAGEGKTTTSVSLTQGLGAIGKKVMLCLREPSMGPVWGIKGGGNGGGYAQVVPMEEFNLHFNGDFHAVSAAHNLLSAALDASIYHGNPLDIDPQSITWPRTMDMNDRELRNIVAGLGGRAHGYPRQDGFVITAASEVMA